MQKKILDHVNYTFYTKYAKVGRIKVKCRYWERIFNRKEGSWISDDGLWCPQPPLGLELEALYTKAVGP